MAGWKMDHLKMYFLGKRWVFQPQPCHRLVTRRGYKSPEKFPWPLFSDAFRIGPGRLGTGDGEFEGPSAVQSEPSEHLDFATRNQIGRNFQGLRTAAVLSYTYQTNLEVTRGHFQTKPMNLEGVRGWINIPFFMPKCSIAMRIL